MPPKASRFLLILDGGAAGKVERIDAESNCVDQIGADLQRFIDVCEPFGQVVAFKQGNTAAKPRFGEVGVKRQRPIVTGDCLIVPAELAEGVSAPGESKGKVRFQREGAVIRRKSFIVAMKLCKNIAAAEQAAGKIGI